MPRWRGIWRGRVITIVKLHIGNIPNIGADNGNIPFGNFAIRNTPRRLPVRQPEVKGAVIGRVTEPEAGLLAREQPLAIPLCVGGPVTRAVLEFGERAAGHQFSTSTAIPRLAHNATKARR